MTEDDINHPKHYTWHPTGVECIDIIEVMPFNIGNAIKYLWRAGLKGDRIEDMRKALWYIAREIKRLENEAAGRQNARAAAAPPEEEPTNTKRRHQRGEQ